MNRLFLAAACAAGVSMTASSVQTGDVLHGFTVKDVVSLPEVQGRLVKMVYARTGTELAWLDRPDDNKTFAIGFRTFPADDTGVPHIIEHSVLCGSDKYPVKEPFVDLLKSSFATFLNAWTSSDATMYPVCSRNAADFLNLMDVYLDAVLHPLSVRTPMAFRQEGWHWTFKDGALARNGVVYSEMKGAFANPERRLYHEVNRLLFPDTCYRFVSGGDPDAIPSLTFEKYVAFYRRYYHPSNARIFLDGRVDLDAALAKIDAFLAPYSRAEVDAAVQFQKPVRAEKTLAYAVDPGTDPAGKILLAEAWVFGRFDERLKFLAADALTDALCGSNEAPLKKVLLEKGLCEDVRFGVDADAQLSLRLVVKNVKAENVAAVRATVRATLAALAQNGLDRARLAALLDNAEFHDLEKDYGGFPKGLAFFSDAFGQWLYGGDPANAFHNRALFAELRTRLAAGWFERFLAEAVLDNPHHVSLAMTPSTTLGAERAAAEKKALAQRLAGWSAAERERAAAEEKALLAHQNAPDAPADVAKLPVLAVKDVPVLGPETPVTVTKLARAGQADVTVIRPETGANGVMHAELYFTLADFTDAELARVPMLATVLGELATARFDPIALQNALDGRLGSFATTYDAYAKPLSATDARPYFVVRVSALDAKRADALELVPEVLLRTSFADAAAVGKLLKQRRLQREREIQGLSGRVYPRRRAAAQLSALGAVRETFDGFAQLRALQRADDAFAREGRAYADALAALAQRIFTRARLTLCLPANVPLAWGEEMAARLPAGAPAGPAAAHPPYPAVNEGWRIPAHIGFAARVSRPEPPVYCGSACVGARILTLDHLWDEIRVKGGAYGGSFMPGANGDCTFLSWNDPQPAHSLQVYENAGKYLRAFADGREPLARYIVSTVAGTEPYRTPRVETTRAAERFLAGRTLADERRLRAEMLATTRDDVRRLADAVEKMGRARAAVCVLGGEDLLKACSNRLDRTEGVLAR